MSRLKASRLDVMEDTHTPKKYPVNVDRGSTAKPRDILIPRTYFNNHRPRVSVKIEEIAILRFDFALSLEEDSIEQGLENWYGQEGESYFETVFGQGQSSEGTYFSHSGSRECPIGELDHFKSVETSMIRQTQYFTDVVTIGYLADDAVADILEKDDARDDLEEWRTELRSITDYVPIIAEDVNQGNELIQVFPKDGWETFDEDGKLNTAQIHTNLKTASEILGSINFNLSGYISLFVGMGGQHIVIPQIPTQIWNPLISVQTHSLSSDDGESPWLPNWVKTLQILTPYFRSHQWLSYRLAQVQDIDEKTYDVSGILNSGIGDVSDSDLDALIEDESRLAELRRDWTSVFAQATDEFEELKNHHGEIFEKQQDQLNQVDSPEIEGEVRIPKPNRSGLMIGDTSLFDAYRDNLSKRFRSLESILERIGKKQSQIANFIHDDISAKATEANIDLQEDVKLLTWVLVGLTVVLVILTIILVLVSFGVLGSSA